MSFIPPEVVDLVLRELHPPDWDWQGRRSDPLNGKADIHACTLVSRTWHGVAAPLLFRDINYTFLTEIDPEFPVAGTLPYELRGGRYKTLSMFRQFLKDHPRIARCVSRLRLDNYWTEELTGVYDFVEILITLPNLRVLLLHNVVLGSGPDGIVPSLDVTRHVQLDFLRVSCFVPQNGAPKKTTIGLHDLTELLALFSRIDELHLFRIDLDFIDADTDPVAHGLDLDSLEVRSLILTNILHNGAILVYRMLQASSVANTLRALTLDYRDGVVGGAADEWYFQSICADLRELTYNFGAARHLSPLDLSTCPNLKKLTVEFKIDGGENPRPTLEAVNTFLSIDFSSQLDDLNIAIIFENVFSPTEFSWRMMCRGTLQRLDRTFLGIIDTHGLHKIYFACSPMNAEIRGLLADMFPTTNRRLKMHVGSFSLERHSRLIRDVWNEPPEDDEWLG